MGGRTRRLGHRPLRRGGQPGVPLPREAAGRLSRPNACDSDVCTLGDACVDEGESDIEMVQEVVRAIREAGARADSSCGIHVHVGFGQRFLEALNRAKPDTLESFAAIWYRHNSEAGYYWEMLARHHYDHSFSYLPGACLT